MSPNAAAVIKPLKYEGGGKANDVGEARIYVHQVHSDVRVQEGGARLCVRGACVRQDCDRVKAYEDGGGACDVREASYYVRHAHGDVNVIEGGTCLRVRQVQIWHNIHFEAIIGHACNGEVRDQVFHPIHHDLEARHAGYQQCQVWAWNNIHSKALHGLHLARKASHFIQFIHILESNSMYEAGQAHFHHSEAGQIPAEASS